MSNKMKLVLGGVGAIVLLAVIILLWPNKSGDIQVDIEYRLPSYIQLDSPDTYHGLVDITGTWVNTMAQSDTITFAADMTYTSSVFAANGTYGLGDGYVMLNSIAGTSEALRMVVGNGVDIFLQMDDESLAKTYRRVLAGEALEETPVDSEEEEVLRHYLSSINQILRKSTWNSETDGVDKILISGNSIQLYANGTLASEWAYKVLAPDSGADVPFDPPYVVPILVDGLEYTLRLDTEAAPEYSTGYLLSISSADNTLLQAKSTKPINFEEP